MPPVVCIVGKPKSGKTTIIEKLIPELKKRGYSVATIKHTTHDFEVDTEGKDSWKHAQAGSDCTVLSSAQRVSLIRKVDHDLSPSELARFVSNDFDIILAEGFKKSEELKIEVNRSGGELVCPIEDLLAVITDESLPNDILRYSPDDISGLATLIEEKVLKRKEKIAIFADGKPVPLKPFIVHLCHKMISDMVAPLKGIGKPKNYDISIRK